MPRIFVSHAARDEALVEEFVELLQVGVNVHPDDVFCSSLPGMNIPTGRAFVEHIKSQVQDPEIVLLIISSEFLKSQFCLNEVGASWALSLSLYPLLVPPLGYGDVRGVLAGVQAAKIDDKEKLNDLRDDLIEKLQLTPLRTSHWERKRDKFLGKLSTLVVQVPSSIERSSPVAAKEEHTRLVVSSSGTWLKLDDRFYDAERFERQGRASISLRISPGSPEDEAALEHLRSYVVGRNKVVGYAYQNDGGLARIDKMSSISQGGVNHWAIEITVVEDSNSGFLTEMAYGFGGRQYSPDDIAEMRAGRLLFNEPPPPRRRTQSLEEGLLEAAIAGRSDSPVRTEECVIRGIVKGHRGAPEAALVHARLEAVYRLKGAGIIESVLELSLGPIVGEKLHVRFRGRRPRRYQSEEPEIISIEGDCELN
jgi:hypothetical protein